MAKKTIQVALPTEKVRALTNRYPDEGNLTRLIHRALDEFAGMSDPHGNGQAAVFPEWERSQFSTGKRTIPESFYPELDRKYYEIKARREGQPMSHVFNELAAWLKDEKGIDIQPNSIRINLYRREIYVKGHDE